MASLDVLGQPTIVARLDTLAATTYHFQVVAGDGLFAGASPVGTFTTGPGVSAFDVAVGSDPNPALGLGSGLSPYAHLGADSFAAPLLEIVGGAAPMGCGATVIDFGGSPYCLAGIESGVAPTACPRATVTYALAGVAASGVVIRAFPTVPGEAPDGSPTLDGILEANGPAGSGSVDIGCLASGLGYSIVVDAVGDDAGILAAHTIEVP
jgi:hypothetical protein